MTRNLTTALTDSSDEICPEFATFLVPFLGPRLFDRGRILGLVIFAALNQVVHEAAPLSWGKSQCLVEYVARCHEQP